jgi:hypothetical protein
VSYDPDAIREAYRNDVATGRVESDDRRLWPISDGGQSRQDWAGLLRMALARQAAGLAPTDLDSEAFRRAGMPALSPDDESGGA